MVEIDDIKDRDSFKSWLDALPKETVAEQAKSRSVAITLAARVLPVFWNWTLPTDDIRAAAAGDIWSEINDDCQQLLLATDLSDFLLRVKMVVGSTVFGTI